MINALAELGAYDLKNHPKKDFLDQILDDAYDSGRYKYLLTIVFEKNSLTNSWQYKRVLFSEFASKDKRSLLYKRGPSRGTDFTPTSKVTDKDTFSNKLLQWFKQQKDNQQLSETDRNFLINLYQELVANQRDISKKLYGIKENITDKSGAVLTVAFKENERLKYPGNLPLFKQLLEKEAVNDYKYSKANKVYSFGSNKLCAICNRKQAEVFGFFTDLKFYNVDKQGMITGGFNLEEAWKNYPVCLDCALKIRTGYEFAQENFNFKFYGLSYLFIPKITSSTVYDEVVQTLLGFKKEPKFKPDDITMLTDDEDSIIEYLREEMGNLTFSLFFFNMPQKSVLRIVMLIEDILPSRIRQIFELKTKLDEIVFFKDAQKNGQRLCYFNFGTLRNFFPNNNIEGNLDKSFLEITEKIFTNKNIDFGFLIQCIMKKIKRKFTNSEAHWLDTLKAFMLLEFLFLSKKEKRMDEQLFKEFRITSGEFQNKVDLFFKNFAEFFSDDARKAIFLMGSLTDFLLNIQKEQKEKRGNAPFRSKLKGLKMSAYDISILLPKIIDKLEQYDANYYQPMEEFIAKLLLSAGDYKKWRISVDEMNFIFTLGMTLSKYFKIHNKKEENNNG